MQRVVFCRLLLGVKDDLSTVQTVARSSAGESWLLEVGWPEAAGGIVSFLLDRALVLLL
jgi:hypothetical protein